MARRSSRTVSVFRDTLIVFIAATLAACASGPSVRKSVEGVLSRHLDRSPPAPAEERAPASKVSPLLATARRIGFQRPLETVTITSPFGPRGGRAHQGVDFHAPRGTPFYAAADGEVIFAGSSIHGYGNAIILLHAGRFSTLYAHADSLLVRPGERVVRGQPLGYVGDTGNATAPHLHFELRRELDALDPGRYVPVYPIKTSPTGG